MRFQLLGPVLAWSGDRSVSLGVRQQRFVLAVLALEVNRLVPVRRLVDLIWPVDPPSSARGMVQTHISKLRAILRDCRAEEHGVELRRMPAGYTLTCEPAKVDAHRFEELVAQARGTGDEPRRVALLDEALGLWRGPALTGITGEDVRITLCRHLDEMRLAATEDRVDALLRLGRHQEVIDDLVELSATHVDRQRMTGQLMLALHRAGRTGEALRAYERARQVLADELGLDPGVELRQLRQAILRDDPVLTAAVPARRPAPVRPAQLPADPVTFTGRAADLERLRSLATTRTPAVVICAVTGMAGIGKTALAVHFGHRIAAEYPDGQLYLNLRGNALDPPVPPADALGALLRGLGLQPDQVPVDEAERAATFRSLTADRRILLVLDDARGAEQVAPLLPGGPGCLVLITSRGSMAAVDGAAHLRLEPLPGADGMTMLRRMAGPGRMAAEPKPVSALVRLCAGLPLALRIVGARLATRPTWPVAALVERLRDERRRLDELRIAERAVRAGFAVSHQALEASADPVDRAAARLFRLVGALDWVDLSVPVAAALLDAPQPDTYDALERLVDDHLLDSVACGRYHAHDLLRLFARELAGGAGFEQERQAALCRVMNCHIAAAEQAIRLLDPAAAYRVPAEVVGPEEFGLHTPRDATSWVEAEHTNLVAVTRQATAVPGLAAHVVRLTAALVPPFDNRGYRSDIGVLRELAAVCATVAGDRPGEAMARQDLGWAYLRTGRADEAIATLRRALALWRDLGDFRGEQACLNHLGLVCWQQERFGDAADHLKQALAICRANGHPTGETAALDLLGLVSQRLDRFDEAIAYHEEALAIAHAMGDPVGEAGASTNLGRALHGAGRVDEAIRCHERSLAIYRTVGGRFGEAEALWGLGQACHALDHVARARVHWRNSIGILREIGKLTDGETETLLRQQVPETPAVLLRYT